MVLNSPVVRPGASRLISASPRVRADAKKGEEESDRTEYVPYGAMVHVHVRAVVAGRGGEGESDCVRVS